MRKLVDTFMNEPAVALGVLAAAIIAVFKVVDGATLKADDLLAVLTPLGTGLGIRQFVCPCVNRREAGATPATESPSV